MKMLSCAVAATVACYLFICCCPYALAQDGATLVFMSGKAIDAIDKAKGAYSDLVNVDKILTEIEANRTPSIHTNPYAQVADKYNKVAEDLRNAPLPTEFNATIYTITLKDFSSCAARAAGMAKLNGYLKELKAGLQRADMELASIDQALQEEANAEKILKHAIDVHDKLITVPVYGEIFKWDWYELRVNVTKSLAELRSALNAQRARIVSDKTKVAAGTATFEANLRVLEQIRCDLLGLWDGTMSDARKSLPFEVWLVKNGDSIECSYRLNHNDDNAGTCSDLKITNNAIAFTLNFSDYKSYLTGSANADRTAMSGTFTTTGGRGTWSVRWKQD
jgi:hypothetical protein